MTDSQIKLRTAIGVANMTQRERAALDQLALLQGTDRSKLIRSLIRDAAVANNLYQTTTDMLVPSNADAKE